MDNLTHTLVGMVAGELVARTVRPAQAQLSDTARRVTLIGIGMVGGNLPDSDLAWSMGAVTGDNLGYLLEHRGYTHTLIGCAVLAVGLLAAAVSVLRWRGLRESLGERWLLAGMTVFSLLLHIAMDALNSYGVHPFWPWNNRWFYGDAVFIIEPLYWLSTAPLLMALQSLRARILLGIVLFIGNFALLIVHRFGLLWWWVPVATVLLVLQSRRWSARQATLVSTALLVAVTLCFKSASLVASTRLGAIAAQQFPDFETLDQVLSPLPVQPLCWDVLLVQRSTEQYAVRRGQLALLGSIESASCPQLLGGGSTTAVLQPVTAANVPALQWSGQFTLPTAQLVALATEDCRARELMQFVRAPFATQLGDGWVLGDLRFDREAGLGMAEVLVRASAPGECRYEVPWLPPRSDLLMRTE